MEPMELVSVEVPEAYAGTVIEMMGKRSGTMKDMKVDAVNIPDPQNPVGVRGMGEPIMGGTAAAILCAISDALGGHYFYRHPVLPLHARRGSSPSLMFCPHNLV